METYVSRIIENEIIPILGNSAKGYWFGPTKCMPAWLCFPTSGTPPLGGILRSTTLLVGCSDHAVLNKSQPAYNDTICICQRKYWGIYYGFSLAFWEMTCLSPDWRGPYAIHSIQIWMFSWPDQSRIRREKGETEPFIQLPRVNHRNTGDLSSNPSSLFEAENWTWHLSSSQIGVH